MEDHTAQLLYWSGQKKPLTNRHTKGTIPRCGLLGAAGAPAMPPLPGVSVLLLKNIKCKHKVEGLDQFWLPQEKTPC